LLPTKYILFFLHLFFLNLVCFAQKPVITSFAPQVGPVGTSVTITGTGFSSSAAENIVRFGAVKARVLSASATMLTVRVPSGASYQPLTVMVNGLMAYSKASFNVSFPGAGNGFSDSSFIQVMDSSTKYGPAGAVSGDLDDDGKPDLAVVDFNNNLLYIFRNTSDIGHMQMATRIDSATGIQPKWVALEDLNGDGKLDIVVLNTGSDNVTVYINNCTPGSIALFKRMDLPVGSNPQGITIGDVDDDGRPDIVVSNTGAATVSILRNTTTGQTVSFAGKRDIPTGKSPVGVAVADLNGDGKRDLIVGDNEDFAVAVFANTSTSDSISFGVRTDYHVTTQPIAITATDLDGDGLIDIISGSSTSGNVSLLRNVSASGAISLAPKVDIDAQSPGEIFHVADMDGDGKADIVVSSRFFSKLTIFKNTSVPGSFQFNRWSTYIWSNSALGMTETDLDGDGLPDLAFSNFSASNVVVLRNRVTSPVISSFSPGSMGSGGKVVIKGLNFSNTSDVRFGGVAAASFSVDSSTGITAVVDTGASGSVTVVTPYGRASANGFIYAKAPSILSFSPIKGGKGTPVTIRGTNFSSATAVDFGGVAADSFRVVSPSVLIAYVGSVPAGTLDVAVTNPSGAATLPGFYTGVVINSFYPDAGPAGTTVTIEGGNFSSVASDNIVYFGAVSAVVTAATVHSLQVIVPAGATYRPITVTTHRLTAYSAKPFVVTFKSATPAFTDTSFAEVADSTAQRFPLHTAVSDLNNDGKADMVVTNFASNSISILRNTSTGGAVSFAPSQSLAVYLTAVRSAIGDLDGDGKPDIVTVTRYGNAFTDSIYIFHNTSVNGGVISFDRASNVLAAYETSATSVSVRDLNGDGKPDLIVTDEFGGSVQLFQNVSTQDSIGFIPLARVDGGSLPQDIDVADIDGDGKPDLALTTQTLVMVHRNISPRSDTIVFGPGIYFDAGFSPGSISLGDLDGDGMPEMVVTNRGNDNFSVYRNTSVAGEISFAGRVSYGLGNIPYNISIGDLDGDGRPDLAVTTRNSSTITIFRNNGSLGNLSFLDSVQYPGRYCYELRHVAIADMNGDSHPDLVVTEGADAANAVVFLNKIPGDGKPAVLVQALTPTDVCPGDSVTLQADAVGGAQYQWYRNGQAVGDGTGALYEAKMAGSYTVVRTSAGVAAASSAVNVTVRPAVNVPVILNNDTLLCPGGAVNLVATMAYGYQWYRDGMELPDGTEQSYLTGNSGLYTIRASGCNSGVSNAVRVVTNAAPEARVMSADPLTFCMGDSARLQANTGNGLSYQWYAGSSPIPGAVADSYSAAFSGDFSVRVSSNECSASSTAATVNAAPTPAKASITRSGNTLVSSIAQGNQWYKGGVALQGETNQQYKPVANGDYSVMVTLGTCQGPMSDVYSFKDSLVTGINGPVDSSQLILYGPNPVRDGWRIDFHHILSVTSVYVELYDAKGSLYRKWVNVASGTLLHIGDLPRGIYLAHVYNDKGHIHATIKIVKE